MSKLKKVILVMILTIVAVIAVATFDYKSYARSSGLVTTDSPDTVYSEDVLKATDLWSDYGDGGIPVTMYANDAITLWCIEHGDAVRKYATASEKISNDKIGGVSEEYEEGTITYDSVYTRNSNTLISDNYMKVSDGATLYRTYYKTGGFVSWYYDNSYDFFNDIYESTWKYFEALINEKKKSYNHYYVSAYKQSYKNDDDQTILTAMQKELPGEENFVHGKVYELTYKQKEVSSEYNQDALYVLTAMPEDYVNNIDNFPLTDVTLTDEQKKEGRANNTWIEKAIWGTTIGGGEGGASGTNSLSRIASYYKEFYEAVGGSDDTTAYADNLTVYSYDEYGEETTLSPSSSITLGGVENIDVYEYENTVVEVDTNNDYYILGPFEIDYTVDDDNLDTYLYTYESNGDAIYVKLNSIQKITLYNQDGEEIDDSCFYITYKYDENGTMNTYEYDNYGNLEEVDSATGSKITQIFNTTAVTVNDNGSGYGEGDLVGDDETKGFVSGTEDSEDKYQFYIVIDRSGIDAKDFTGYYLKIDFAYLSYIEGEIYEYESQVNEYYYKWMKGSNYSVGYNYNIKVYTVVDEEDGEAVWGWKTEENSSINLSVPTWYATLEYKEDTEDAQDLLGYKHGTGKRYYNIYSIVITSDLGEEEEPEIEITKYAEDGSTPLYGAVYEISMTFSGNDTYGNSVHKTVSGVYAVTDLNGKISLTATEIEQKFGVYLGNFKGTVAVSLTEVQAPAGYEISGEDPVAYINLSKGKITNATSGNKYEITLNDKKSKEDETVLRIKKTNTGGNTAVDAYFEIQVSYQTGMYLSNGTVYLNGDLVDLQQNIIRGQTTNGILNLTNSDFDNIFKYEDFNFSSFTGAITLDIVEMKVEGEYSLKSENKDITIVLNNGQIVYYSENTNGEVLASYFESWSSSYYKEDGTYVETYTESTAYSYLREVSMDNGIITIVVEDTAGSYTEIIETPPPTTSDLFMNVAGIAFLDQTTNKANENDSNGYYDSGETLLANIRVELHVGSAGGAIADLYQYDENEDKIVKYTEAAVTWTDENGYYEFVGVDPFDGPYYVVFIYNGVEYEVSTDNGWKADGYNTDDSLGNGSGWDDSSKAEESGSRNNFTEITATTVAYDYYEIESIYEEIATIGRYYVNTFHKTEGLDDYITSTVLSNHASESTEVAKILEYITEANMTAVYDDYVPYSQLGGADGRFIINSSGANAEEDYLDFAGTDDIPYIYPGQLQINIGLTERDSTDLQLLTDVLETTVSINGYDTVYSYDRNNSEYSQYIYEEDYNYSTSESTDGTAYYDNDEIEYYVTYEIEVSNISSTSTKVLEVVDYYSNYFEWAASYKTSKGNTISGIKINGVDYSSKASDLVHDSAKKQGTFYDASAEMTGNISDTSENGYSGLYINLSSFSSISKNSTSENSSITIQITFKLKDASETLKDNILNADTWSTKNYAEITAYSTSGGFLDSDSKPGNFSISEFEEIVEKYYAELSSSGFVSAMNLYGQRMTEIREDDAWRVIMNVDTSSYHRSLSGSVWEAISDSVQTSSDLQDYSGLLEYVADHGIEGIKVELVELCEDKDNEGELIERVRACTRTDSNGNYKFTNYIAGNYVVRFTYGETDRSILSDYSTTTAGDALEINGQYYQSTKANDATDLTTYWYDEDIDTRYSDAYDDATSRENQIDATIASVTDDSGNTTVTSTSDNYEWDGVYNVQSYKHKDTIYAYTSTLNLEIEYVGNDSIGVENPTNEDNFQRVTGNLANSYYTYDIVNVDFGLTPRALADINIDKYVSNIKIYLQDGTLQLDAYPVEYNGTSWVSLYVGSDQDIEKTISSMIDELSTSGAEKGDIKWLYLNDEIYENSVLSTYTSNYEPDGLIEVLLDEGILNGATLEVTYAITVSNDGEYDTITWWYGVDENNNQYTIAVAYYGENYCEYENNKEVRSLPSYESSYIGFEDGVQHIITSGDNDHTEWILLHDVTSETETYSYEKVTGTSGRVEVTTAATNIVDYIDPNLNFVQVNYEGESINTDWQLTTTADFNTYREKFNGSTEYDEETGDSVEFPDLMSQYNTIISGATDNVLYKELLPGETTTTTLTLSKVLSTSSTGTSDYEYSNLIEIAKVYNYVGRVTEIEGYDVVGNLGIDGYPDEETSTTKKISEVNYTNYSPTIGTSKSEKIYRHEATGLSISEEAKTNLGIILIALVILAGGIFLIKKFVLTPKVE